MDAHVTGQFVRPGEALLAGGKGALMGAFTGVGADMAGLVLETVEGFGAEVAFVGAGGILTTSGRG